MNSRRSLRGRTSRLQDCEDTLRSKRTSDNPGKNRSEVREGRISRIGRDSTDEMRKKKLESASRADLASTRGAAKGHTLCGFGKRATREPREREKLQSTDGISS